MLSSHLFFLLLIHSQAFSNCISALLLNRPYIITFNLLSVKVIYHFQILLSLPIALLFFILKTLLNLFSLIIIHYYHFGLFCRQWDQILPLANNTFSVYRKFISIQVPVLHLLILLKYLNHLIPIYPAVRIEHQTLLNQLVQKSKLFVDLDPPSLFKVFSATVKRMLLIEHLVKNNSQRPDVALNGIRSQRIPREKDLRSHRIRCATTPTLHLQTSPNMFSQPEVSYLDNSLRNEDVLKLQISMNKIPELQFIQALQNLLDILEHLWQLIIAGN